MEELGEAELNRLLGEIEREMGIGPKLSESSSLLLSEAVSNARQPRGSEKLIDLGAVAIRDTNAHYMKKFDARIAKRVIFILFSNLDEDTKIQFLGSDTDVPREPSREFEIGGELSLSADDKIAVMTAFNRNWFPWFGIRITAASSPDRGEVRAIAWWQRELAYTAVRWFQNRHHALWFVGAGAGGARRWKHLPPPLAQMRCGNRPLDRQPNPELEGSSGPTGKIYQFNWCRQQGNWDQPGNFPSSSGASRLWGTVRITQFTCFWETLLNQ